MWRNSREKCVFDGIIGSFKYSSNQSEIVGVSQKYDSSFRKVRKEDRKASNFDEKIRMLRLVFISRWLLEHHSGMNGKSRISFGLQKTCGFADFPFTALVERSNIWLTVSGTWNPSVSMGSMQAAM